MMRMSAIRAMNAESGWKFFDWLESEGAVASNEAFSLTVFVIQEGKMRVRRDGLAFVAQHGEHWNIWFYNPLTAMIQGVMPHGKYTTEKEALEAIQQSESPSRKNKEFRLVHIGSEYRIVPKEKFASFLT